jgi:hypothetical protein
MRLSRTSTLGLGVAAVSVGALLFLDRTRLGDLIHERIPDRPRRRLLRASSGFFLTFAGVRALTWSIHHKVGHFTTSKWGDATFTIWYGES